MSLVRNILKPIRTSPMIFTYLILAGGMLCISFASFFIRWSHAPGMVTSTYRMLLAMLIQTPVFLFTFKSSMTKAVSPGAGYFWPILAGISLGLCLILWTYSVEITRIANASLLGNTAPIFVSLIAVFIQKQRIPRLFWLGLILAVSGMALVILQNLLTDFSLSYGDLLALISAIFYALYYVFMGNSRRTIATTPTIWVINVSTTLVLLLYCWVRRYPLWGYSPRDYMLFFVNALVAQILGYYATTYAAGRIPAWILSSIMLFQPVLTSLMAIPLMGEDLRFFQVIGGIVVLAGIYVIRRTTLVQKPFMDAGASKSGDPAVSHPSNSRS